MGCFKGHGLAVVSIVVLILVLGYLIGSTKLVKPKP